MRDDARRCDAMQYLNEYMFACMLLGRALVGNQSMTKAAKTNSAFQNQSEPAIQPAESNRELEREEKERERGKNKMETNI